MHQQMPMKNENSVLDRFRSHPEFMGIELSDVNQKGAVDDAPLHIASRSGRSDDVIALIALGANVNQQGDLANAPLHYAAMTGRDDIVDILITHGADRGLKNEFGQSPSDVAELAGYDALAARLK